jgi:alkylhydroperoxidase/carboxymuconolactone decarboxylase family protein YurZ
MTLDPRRRELRDSFLAERGFWTPELEAVLQADPDFFAAYLEFSAVPARHGALPAKVRELIYVAVDASTTHLHADGTRAHIQAALRAGATQAEIMEVLELTSVLGIHTCTLAVPILLEEASGPDGPDGAAAELTPRQEELKREFVASRGFWAPPFEAILRADPDFFAAYAAFSGVPWANGVLPPKVKELVYLAVDAATTHLHAGGTRAHLRRALQHGATREEIMEVLEVTSVLGIHTATMAVPILLEELQQASREQSSD